MTQPYNATSAYSEASKMVSPLRAIVLLYDGIIQAVGQAKLAIEEGRIEDRFNATQKACKIVLGLQANLDFDQGGDVSVMLDQFYHRLFRDLQQINMANSPVVCDRVLKSVGEVRESWKTLAQDETQGGGAAGPRTAAPRADQPASNVPPVGGMTLSV